MENLPKKDGFNRQLVYRPPKFNGSSSINATLGVKFAQATRILDPWYILGGTRWSRTSFRLKHPWVYCKRGLRNLYRRIRRLFIKDKMIQCKKLEN